MHAALQCLQELDAAQRSLLAQIGAQTRGPPDIVATRQTDALACGLMSREHTSRRADKRGCRLSSGLRLLEKARLTYGFSLFPRRLNALKFSRPRAPQPDSHYCLPQMPVSLLFARRLASWTITHLRHQGHGAELVENLEFGHQNRTPVEIARTLDKSTRLEPISKSASQLFAHFSYECNQQGYACDHGSITAIPVVAVVVVDDFAAERGGHMRIIGPGGGCSFVWSDDGCSD